MQLHKYDSNNQLIGELLNETDQTKHEILLKKLKSI